MGKTVRNEVTKFPDGSKQVKARLVVKGFQDGELKALVAASPTANRES